MGSPGTINVDDFIQRLLQEGLVIVPKTFLDQQIESANLAQKRKDLLSKRSLTLWEIEKFKVIPKTRQTLRNWIENGVIDSKAVYVDKKGTTRIMTYEIKRIIKDKGLD